MLEINFIITGYTIIINRHNVIMVKVKENTKSFIFLYSTSLLISTSHIIIRTCSD